MSSDAEASKVPFEIFFHINCHLSEFTELKYTSLIKKKNIILEDKMNFKWHLEAFASELFKYACTHTHTHTFSCFMGTFHRPNELYTV